MNHAPAIQTLRGQPLEALRTHIDAKTESIPFVPAQLDLKAPVNRPIQINPVVFLPYFAAEFATRAFLNEVRRGLTGLANKVMDTQETISWVTHQVTNEFRNTQRIADGLYVRGKFIPIEHFRRWQGMSDRHSGDGDQEAWLERFRTMIESLVQDGSIDYERVLAPHFDEYIGILPNHKEHLVIMASDEYGRGLYVMDRTIILDYSLDALEPRKQFVELPWQDALLKFTEDPIIIDGKTRDHPARAIRSRLLWRDYLKKSDQGAFVSRWTNPEAIEILANGTMEELSQVFAANGAELPKSLFEWAWTPRGMTTLMLD